MPQQQQQRSTKPKPVDVPGSIQPMQVSSTDSDTTHAKEFRRQSVRRPSQQSALSLEACKAQDDVWQELSQDDSDPRPEPRRQNSQRVGVWGWDAIVPRHNCSGSPAAYEVVSQDVW